MPCCARCGREVFYAEQKIADGKYWHSFCFSCYKCRKLLDACSFNTYCGEIFCKSCFKCADLCVELNQWKQSYPQKKMFCKDCRCDSPDCCRDPCKPCCRLLSCVPCCDPCCNCCDKAPPLCVPSVSCYRLRPAPLNKKCKPHFLCLDDCDPPTCCFQRCPQESCCPPPKNCCPPPPRCCPPPVNCCPPPPRCCPPQKSCCPPQRECCSPRPSCCPKRCPTKPPERPVSSCCPPVPRALTDYYSRKHDKNIVSEDCRGACYCPEDCCCPHNGPEGKYAGAKACDPCAIVDCCPPPNCCRPLKFPPDCCCPPPKKSGKARRCCPEPCCRPKSDPCCPPPERCCPSSSNRSDPCCEPCCDPCCQAYCPPRRTVCYPPMKCCDDPCTIPTERICYRQIPEPPRPQMCTCGSPNPCDCDLNLRCKQAKLENAPCCRRCGRKVYAAEKIMASGGAFHTCCFNCYCCHKQLEVPTVCENMGEIYCKKCYGKLFGLRGYGYGTSLQTCI